MSRPGLLRRAAAATLGATGRRTQAAAYTAPVELGLVRRAAAAALGVRSYRLVDAPSSATRVWEVRRSVDATARRSALAAPSPEAATALDPRPPVHDVPRPDPSAWLTVVLDPAAPVMIGPSGTPSSPRKRGPRHTLALAAMAAVLAIAFTAFGYQLRPLIHQQPPAHSVGGDDPTPSSSPSSSAVVKGDVPEAFLGSWSTVISNTEGNHTRSLVVQQGHIGDDVLILVADGPSGSGNYHCVFTAPLTAVSDGGDRLKLGPSTLTSGVPPSSCVAGSTSTLTLGSGDTLRRVSENGETLTYAR